MNDLSAIYKSSYYSEEHNTFDARTYGAQKELNDLGFDAYGDEDAIATPINALLGFEKTSSGFSPILRAIRVFEPSEVRIEKRIKRIENRKPSIVLTEELERLNKLDESDVFNKAQKMILIYEVEKKLEEERNKFVESQLKEMKEFVEKKLDNYQTII
jgi:hypothetical protein